MEVDGVCAIVRGDTELDRIVWTVQNRNAEIECL